MTSDGRTQGSDRELHPAADDHREAAKISGFTVLASVLAFGALLGLIGAIMGVPIAAGLQIVVEE